MGAVTLLDIGDLARAHAAAIGELEEVTDEVRELQRREVRKRLRSIKARAAKVSATRDALAQAIAAAPDLFEKPRTRAVDGVKYGLRKKPGRVAVDDEAGAIARLRKRLGGDAEGLIRVRESLVRDGLRELDARTLAHAGVTLVDAQDEVVIAAARGDLDQLVAALLDGIEDAEEVSA